MTGIKIMLTRLPIKQYFNIMKIIYLFSINTAHDYYVCIIAIIFLQT